MGIARSLSDEITGPWEPEPIWGRQRLTVKVKRD